MPTYYPAVRYGGPIRSVHGLARAQAARGHTVQVFTSSMDGPGDLDVPLGSPVDRDGVTVRYYRVPALRRLCWCPTLARDLRSALRGVDVLHLHSVFLWPTAAAARIARRAGIPYVVSPRGMLGRTVIEAKSRLVKTAWIRLVERRTLREAAAIHVTSDIERAELGGVGLALARVFCLPNGMDMPGTPPAGWLPPWPRLTTPYALFLSRIDPKKGLDRLLRAWPMVATIPLVIAGNDETGYTANLESLATQLGIRERVHFIGPVSDADKWPLLADAVTLLLPSYSENFGNVVAEAMAVGCPVVITPEVGIAEIVRASGAGCVVPGEPRALADTVNQLVGSEALRRQFGAAGIRVVRDQLSWDSVAQRMEVEYHAATAGDPAVRSRQAAQ